MSGVSRRRRDEQLAVREERGLDSEGNGQKQFLLDQRRHWGHERLL